MYSFRKHSSTNLSSTLLGSCAVIGITAGSTLGQPQDRHIVNETGGIGVQQSYYFQTTGTSHGALILYADDRSGSNEYRIRSMDSYGNLNPTSVNIDALVLPDGHIYSTHLASNRNSGDSVFGWKVSGSGGYVYGVVALDQLTGAPSSAAVAVDPFEGIFISDAGNLLLLKAVDKTLEGQFYDSNFNPLGAPVILVDESELDFPDSITQYDVSFSADGSFVMTWTGTLLPYFHQIKSQKFNADGSPAGPINEHTNEGLFHLHSKVSLQSDGTSIVSWGLDDGYMAQKLDAYGTSSGAPVMLFDSSAEQSSPNILSTSNAGDLLAVSQNGFATFDLETLELIHNETWTNSENSSSSAWMPAQETLLVAWRELGADDGDYDIRGQVHQLQGSSSDSFDLSDDVDGAYQTYPSSASNGSGRSVIAWLDQRMSANGNIAFQIYGANGGKSGSNLFLDTPGRVVYSPQVAMNGSGEFAISWVEQSAQSSYGAKSLRAQRFDANGQPDGSPFTIYTESNTLLAPIFGGIGSTYSDKRHLLLLDNGSLYSAWGLMIVTGGTIGNPQYGRTDLFTKAFDAYNQTYSASSNQKMAGAVHGMVASGTNSAQILYYNSTHERLQLLEFSASNASSSDTAFPALPNIGTNLSSNTYVSFTRDQDVLGVTWSRPIVNGGSNRSYTAFYNDDGQLLASDTLENESDFSCMQVTADGTRVVLHGTSNNLYAKMYSNDGTAISNFASISEGESYTVYSTGLPEFEMLLAAGQIRLTRSIESGTDQADDIELSSYEIDIATCSPADFNCDGSVNGYDLAVCLGFWGLPGGDVDGDGTTNGVDLAYVLSAWSE